TRNGKGEESIASFVRRRLGDEILDRLVAPFLSGVYAGDPNRLSVEACFPRLAEFESAAGSIVRGAIRAMRASSEKDQKPKRSLMPYRLCSFRRGLNTLTQTLAKRLGPSLLTEAHVLQIGQNDEFEITIDHHGEAKTLTGTALVIATPASAAAGLLNGLAPGVAGRLSEIEYVSI